MTSGGSSSLHRAGPLVMARFISACVTVAIPLVLARLLELADYGTYKQLFLIAQTLYYVLPFGVAQSLYFFVPRVPDRRPYLVQTLLFLTVMGALATAVIYWGTPLLATALNNPKLVDYRLPLALYTGCALGGFALELSLTSQGRTRDSAVVYLVSDVMRALALVVPLFVGGNLHHMMWAMVVFAVGRMLVAWVVMLRGQRGAFFDGGRFLAQLRYAAPFGGAILLAAPQQYAHQFMVSSVVEPALFAIYAVGCFQLPLVDLLYTPTSEVLMVRLGELDRERRMGDAVLVFQEATARLAFLFLPLSAFLFVAAPEFIGCVFGVRFLDAVPIFRVCVLAIPLAILPLDGVLRARNQTRHIFLSYLVKALVTVPLVYFGVRRFGMLGGIAAWATAEGVGKLMLLSRVPNALSAGRALSLGEIVPWSELLKAATSAGLAALMIVGARTASNVALEALPNRFLFRLLPLVFASVLFAGGYFAVLRLSGVRPWSVFAWLLSPTRKASD